MNHFQESTEIERAEMLRAGVEQVSVAEMDARLQDLGYEREPDSRCSCVAKNMDTGTSFLCAERKEAKALVSA